MLNCGCDVARESESEGLRSGIGKDAQTYRQAYPASDAAFAFGSALHLLCDHCAAACNSVQQLFQENMRTPIRIIASRFASLKNARCNPFTPARMRLETSSALFFFYTYPSALVC